MKILIVAGAVVVLLAIILIAANYLLRDTGRHADKKMIDELNERRYTPATPPPDDTIAQCKQATDWWRMRANVIADDIERDERYWQNIINSGHLARAHWLRELTQ